MFSSGRLPLITFLVVERQPYLFPIGRGAKHVHFLLLRERLEAAGKRDRIQHRRRRVSG